MLRKPLRVNLSRISKNALAWRAFFQMSFQHLPIVMADFAGSSQSC
jgi:hypothetical protein